ncbi:hypothetical protein N431DRAFT_442259 [Stipitochalara longipes BDJ]|nr:hypothetical protein N431DRAFT_442259 [Stipitochalara longipes BDJ]
MSRKSDSWWIWLTTTEAILGFWPDRWASVCVTMGQIFSSTFSSTSKRTTGSGSEPFGRESVTLHSRTCRSMLAGSTFPPFQLTRSPREGAFLGKGHVGGVKLARRSPLSGIPNREIVRATTDGIIRNHSQSTEHASQMHQQWTFNLIQEQEGSCIPHQTPWWQELRLDGEPDKRNPASQRPGRGD